MVVSDDRGQLLLAGAFVIAVALIGLSLVLNAGNYSSTLATQEQSVTQGTDAITVRKSVRVSLSEMVYRLNRGNYSDSTRVTWLAQNVSWYSNATSDYHARRGRLVNASRAPLDPSDRTVNGTRLTQHTEGDFDRPNNAPDGNWTVDDDIILRNATFKITGIEERDKPKFTILLNVSDRVAWTVKVFDDPSLSGGTGVSVVVNNTSTPSNSDCTRSDPIDQGGNTNPLTLDLGNGTVDGEPCPPLNHYSPTSTPYNLTIANGTRAEGKYWLTVNEVGFPDFAGDPETETTDVLYSVAIQYRYQAPRINYVTNMTVAPGELS